MTAIKFGGSVVVTGASGFVGTHVVRLLSVAGYDVLSLRGEEHDLTEGWPEVGDIDGVVHLAGLASVGPSFEEPQRYIEVNSSILTHLGEALLARSSHVRVVVVSSGALYRSSEGPLTERSPLAMASPYAVSKALVENQCRYYRNRGLDIVVARPFNHIGPGQGPGFIVPDLALKLRALVAGDELPTGNLDSSRDYTDVRDVAAAYRMLLELEHPAHTVYNVASGRARTGRELLATLCEYLEIPTPITSTSFRRDLDPDHMVADASRLRSETGWQALIPFRTSIADYLAAAANP